MGAAEETQPLLKQAVVAAQPDPAKVPQRSWRFPLWRVCGDFSSEDVVAGALAWQLPVVAFGWNMQRSLQASFWREVLMLVLVLAGSYILLSISAHVLVFSCGGWPKFPGHGLDDDDMMGPGHPRRHGCHHLFGMVKDLPDQCRDVVIGGLVFIVFVGATVIVSVLAYAARRRQQIREQFGIEGTYRGDLLSWLFCSVCALAQETRTLMAARVHDGVWYGPMVNNEPAVTAPAAQQMV